MLMPAPQELIDIDLTYDYLEEQLEDDCKCESLHTAPDNKECSVLVVARITSCSGSCLLCLNSSVAQLGFMARAGICSDCGASASDCWSVIPI